MIFASIWISGQDFLRSQSLLLCLMFAGSGMLLDYVKVPRSRLLQNILGAATAAIALLAFFQNPSGPHSWPFASLAMLGMLVFLKSFRKKYVLAIQFQWLLLFAVAFSGFIANVFNTFLHVLLFDHLFDRYRIGLKLSSGMLILCLLQLHSLLYLEEMRNYYSKRRDRQIVAQQIVLILSLGLAAGIGGTGIFAKDSMRMIKASLVDSLQSNSRNFIDTVLTAANNSEKIASLASLAENSDVRGVLARLLEIHRRDGVVSIRIRDSNGLSLISAGDATDEYMLKAGLRGRKSVWLAWHDGLHLISSAPFYRGGIRMGDIEVRTSLSQLDTEFDHTQGFGRSGEVVLCARDGNRMRCFPSRLHQEMGIYSHSFIRALPMASALNGQSGVAVGKDYRGKIVMAAYMPISDLGLGMVQKLDMDELFAPARTQILYAFAFLIAASGFASWLLFRRTHPLVQELALAEAYSRTILDNIPEAVVTTDQSGRIESFNAAARKVFGEKFGSGAFSLLEGLSSCAYGDCPSMFECQSGGCTGIEGTTVRSDGSHFPYEMTVGKVSFEGKERCICVVRDLTERRQAELRLQESERYTRHLLDNLQAAVVVHANDGSVKYMNRAATRFFGFEDGLYGQHIPDLFLRFFGEDGKAIALDALPDRRVLANEQPFSDCMFGVELVGQSSPRWGLVSGFPDFDEQGMVREVIVSFVDITERKIAEERLREAGEKLKHLNKIHLVLSEVGGASVRTRSRDELFRSIARIVVDSGGFSMAWIGLFNEEIGDIVPMVCHGHDAKDYLDRFRSTGIMSLQGPAALTFLEGKQQICQEIGADPKAANWMEVALAHGYRSSGSFPFRLGGKVIGVINLYADAVGYFDEDVVRLLEELCDTVSFSLEFLGEQEKRAEAEELLRQANADLELRVEKRTRQLEAANAELEAFSYSVSHDLRAPLRHLDGFSEILARKYADRLDEEAMSYLQRMRKASGRMRELIEDLLALSRVTLHEIRKAEVDLSRIAAEVIEGFGSGNRNVTWTVETGITAWCDGRLMKIAIENLLGNAWKFTTSRVEARIEFGMLEEDGEKVLYVRDNGVGFDMQYSARLFGTFQRLHNAEEFEGTGIGLATVQRIIRKHGGRIWAEAEPGMGATFYFQI